MMCRGRSLLPSPPLRASSVLSRSQSMSRSPLLALSSSSVAAGGGARARREAWIELELEMCIRPTLTTGMHPDLE